MQLFDPDDVPSSVPSDRPVLAATAWPTNGHLVEDLVRAGYLNPDDVTLDPTFGRGTWWSRWKPDVLISHDLRLDGVDFRHLPEVDESIDVVAFDPPYVPQGGTTFTGSKMTEDRDRYGLEDGPTSLPELEDLIFGGMGEALRVLRRGGRLLVKCQSFRHGRVFRPMPTRIVNHAETIGFRILDEMIHLRRPGPISVETRRPRRNHSTLLIFEKPRSPSRDARRLTT